MYYLAFFIYCLKTNFKFFTYRSAKKARILEKRHLFFLAGHKYMALKNYIKAASCFEASHAYKPLIKAYQKLGLYSKAIAVADEQKYYKIGVDLSEHIENNKKAAYFYSFYKPLYAAKLYKKEGFFYEAGECYLKSYQFLSALECYKSCLDEEQKLAGLKNLEEIGIALYFSKEYDDALKLFLKMRDYYSALECAKKLEEPSIIQNIYLLIASVEASQKNYLLAGKYSEKVSKEKALTYYYLAGANEEAIRILVEEEAYEKAINLCIQQSNLDLAYQLATVYHVNLDFSPIPLT